MISTIACRGISIVALTIAVSLAQAAMPDTPVFDSKRKPNDQPAVIQEVPRILVPGTPDCNGIMSDYCGWDFSPFSDIWSNGAAPVPRPGYGGGGGTGGITVTDYDDGSRGVEPIFNRQPGCLYEDMHLQEFSGLVADGLAGSIGRNLNLTLHDPRYQGAWEKRQFQVRRHRPDPTVFGVDRMYIHSIHYMYDRATGAIAQVKFVNSFEAGCIGFVHSK